MKRHGPKTGTSRPLSLNWILRVHAAPAHSARVVAALGDPVTILPSDKAGTELLHIYEAAEEIQDMGNLVATLMMPLKQAEVLKAAVPCLIEVHLRVYENQGFPLTLPTSLLKMLGRLDADLELCVDAGGN